MDDNTSRGESGRLDNVRDTIRAKAADLASNAKEQASQQFESRVGAATTELGSVASALRRAGEELRRDNGSSIGATVIGMLADRLDSVSGNMGGRDLNGTLDDIARLARRNPAAFMGTTAALGFLAARFLKSSSPSWSATHHEELAAIRHNSDYELYRGNAYSNAQESGASSSYASGMNSGSTGTGSMSTGSTGSGSMSSGTGSSAGSSTTGWDPTKGTSGSGSGGL
jgi:hypothetical protein